MQMEVIHRAASATSEYAGGMGIIHIGHAVVLFRQGNDARQIRDIPVHGKHTVGNDEHLVVIRAALFQYALQVLHIAVAKHRFLGFGKTATVNNRGMVEFIRNDEIAFIHCRLDSSGIAVKSRLIDNNGFLFLELGKQFFQFFMQQQVTVDGTHRAGTDAVFANRFDGGLFQAWMIGKAQIVVGRKVDHFFTVDHAFRLVRAFHHFERFIQALGL